MLEELILELLKCQGPGYPDWKPVGEHLIARDFREHHPWNKTDCVKTTGLELSGMPVAAICGHSDGVVSSFSLLTPWGYGDTMEWMDSVIGPHEAEVKSYTAVYHSGSIIECWPRG